MSAEISQYLRFLGVPVIAVRQHGDRTDYPHLAGYDAAYKLFAPFPHALECRTVPGWIQSKTIYSPGFSRYCERSLNMSEARTELNISSSQRVVVVLNGKGGGKHSLKQLTEAAAATPEWLWLVVGKVEADSTSANNLRVVGWCEDTYPYLKAADVAIASGGHNTIMELGTAQLPFLCIPEDRPFDEQKIKAELLHNLGLCIMTDAFPKNSAIGIILKRLQQINPHRWSELMATDGAAQAAKAIESEVKLLSSYQTASHNNSLVQR